MPAKKVVLSTGPGAPDLILTNSSITTWLSCHRKFKLQYEDLISLKAIATPLVIGSIVHEGLADLLQGKGLEHATAHVRTLIKKARAGILEDPEGFEDDAVIIEGMIRGWDKNRGHLKDAKPWVWQDKTWVEQVFEVKMSGGEVITGKIDGVVTLPDGIWVVEHKTAGRVDSAYINRLAVDAQVSMYSWAIWKLLGEKPKGTIYNVLGKPGIRQKKTESPAQFQERLLTELTSDPKYFFSTMLYRDDQQLQDFDKNLQHIIDDVRRERDRKAWVPNTSQCSMIGRTCNMLPICASGMKPEVMALYDKRKALHPELSS